MQPGLLLVQPGCAHSLHRMFRVVLPLLWITLCEKTALSVVPQILQTGAFSVHVSHLNVRFSSIVLGRAFTSGRLSGTPWQFPPRHLTCLQVLQVSHPNTLHSGCSQSMHRVIRFAVFLLFMALGEKTFLSVSPQTSQIMPFSCLVQCMQRPLPCDAFPHSRFSNSSCNFILVHAQQRRLSLWMFGSQGMQRRKGP